jgi:hypothetical protein
MRRYQELADSIMYRELQLSEYIVSYGFQNGLTDTSVQSLFDAQAKTPILNMLNAKYLIYNPGSAPIINHRALGNAWFVGKFKFAENANDEMAALKILDPAVEAVIDTKFQAQLKGFTASVDSTATIKLIEYAPDFIVYESNTSKEQLAVFSEIYYPHGWVVTVDGKPADHFRANYVLRAMRVPAGKHTIKFEFIPEIYKTGVLISYACSITLLLMIFAGAFIGYRKKYLKKE